MATLKLIAGALLAQILLVANLASAVPPKLPPWDEVQKVVESQLNSVANYQSGDLITRNQVDPIFDKLSRLGWNVADRVDIVNSVKRDDDLMVRQLRSGAGRKFMRQVNKMPLSFDRIDRLDRFPMGPETVDSLITGPDGYKMIQYMTTTQNGRNMGKMLSQDPHGANFNSPTGRIYTAEDLLGRLNKSYEAALQGK
jgi:hypothetical protein